jgi:hypothetical protein
VRIFSPTAAGFGLIFRRPSVPIAEIAWRWTVSVAAWFLAIWLVADYANSLPVTNTDRLLLGTHQPVLVLRALGRIFHGSGLRFTVAWIVLACALTIAWIVVASLGREATLRAIIDALGMERVRTAAGRVFTSLLGLNFLRSAVLLAAIIGAVGSILIASGVWASTHISGQGAARLWLALLLAVWISWSVLNWTLSTASLFIVCDGRGALASIASTLGWSRDRRAAVFAAGLWFGLIHAGAFVLAWGAAFTVFGMAQLLGPSSTVFLEILILAAYCAFADFLYIGRLAAYLVITRGGGLPDLAFGPELRSSPRPERATIDQGELILSDLPSTGFAES